MSDTVYIVYWTTADGPQEEEFSTQTEATIRKAELKRLGFPARVVPVRKTIGD